MWFPTFTAQRRSPSGQAAGYGKVASARPTVETLEARNLLSGFTLGDLMQVSGPISPFADFTGDVGPGVTYLNAEVEPWIAVDPTDPDHLVASWQQDRRSPGGALGFVAAVTFDGGATWEQVVIPGLTLASGGEFQGGADTWLSFAPNGDLHHIVVCADYTKSEKKLGHDAILANKSVDGGLTWSDPIKLIEDKNNSNFNDKPSITADPTDPNRVYAVWSRFTGGFEVKVTAPLARSTDGGQTWTAPEPLHESTDVDGNAGHQIVVLPDGTLIDTFTEQLFTGFRLDGGEISVVRSTDHGLTWGPRITVGQIPPGFVSDPDTGQFVRTGPGPFGSHDVAVDPNSGHLYAVWQDTGFSAGQYNSIAFSMSTDGGLTWSAPVAINPTPTDIDPGNQQAFMPSIEVAADGTVGVTYYDFRNNTPAAGLPTDYWFIHADPEADLTNPASWTEELRLTDASFDLQKAPFALGGLNLGEYQGLATVADDFVTAFTQPHGTDLASIFFRRIFAGEAMRATASGPSPGSAILDPAFGGAIWLDDNACQSCFTEVDDDRWRGELDAHATVTRQWLTWRDGSHDLSTIVATPAAGKSTSLVTQPNGEWFAAVDSLLEDMEDWMSDLL